MKNFKLVEMTSGLVYLGYSVPKGQADKLNFFVPWGQRVYSTFILHVRRGQFMVKTTDDLKPDSIQQVFEIHTSLFCKTGMNCNE